VDGGQLAHLGVDRRAAARLRLLVEGVPCRGGQAAEALRRDASVSPRHRQRARRLDCGARREPPATAVRPVEIRPLADHPGDPRPADGQVPLELLDAAAPDLRLDRPRHGAPRDAHRGVARLRTPGRRGRPREPPLLLRGHPPDHHRRPADHARPAGRAAGAHVPRVAEQADVRDPGGPRDGDDADVRASAPLLAAASALVVAACSSSTQPTPIPPSTPDPPKITCPAPQTIQMVTTDASIPVTYGTATAIGGKPPVTVTCRPESGSPFKVGQTTVICTATDAVGQADSCSFAVTVLPPPRLVATTFVGFGDSITAGESGLGVLSGTAALEPFSRFRPTVLLPASQWYTTVLQQSLAARYRTQTPTVANAGKTGEAV